MPVFQVILFQVETEDEKISADSAKNSKRKPLSKAAIANKLFKKNIRVNKKVVFNEDSVRKKNDFFSFFRMTGTNFSVHFSGAKNYE